jgi:dihydroorotate dehydrogenase
LPVACTTVDEHQAEVAESIEMGGSWAVSFGMPSSATEIWQRDIEETKAALAPGQLLSVSVVGTVQQGWDMRQLAEDYAECARMAAKAGADLIETNFSCPNVSTCDGQLYQHADDAGLVAELTRAAIGQTPFLAKVGHLPNPVDAQRLIESIAPFVDGVAMTNSIATLVRGHHGNLLFAGQKRGICGKATLDASVRQTESIRKMVDRLGIRLDLIGVGGASTIADVQRYLDVGAQCVHIATAAMMDPLVAVKIRQDVQDIPANFPANEKN